MFSMLTFIAACAGVYFLWRIAEALPDLTFRVSEIQRDLAELRRGREQD